MTKPEKYQFLYQSQNCGDLKVSHESRNNKDETDTFVVENEKGKNLATITLSHSIKTANALRLVDSVLESIDYSL